MIGVFGGAGFLGKNVVTYLRAQGLQVRAVSRQFDDPDLFDRIGAERVIADLQDYESLSRAMNGLSDVIQLVSTASPGHGNTRLIRDIETSLIPQVRFLELCQGNGVARVVFASSGGTIYGKPQMLPIPESHPTLPLSSYGLIKLVTEQYLKLFSQSFAMSHVAMRISNPYGPYQRFKNGQGLIANVIAHCLDGTPVPVYGDGLAERDYIYVDDVSTAFYSALRKSDVGGQTFNIGSGVGRSVIEVLDTIEHLMGKKIPRSHIPARSTDVDRSMLDISAARDRLGWEPTVGFEEGLRRTLAFAGLIPD
ncbi:MAG: NAD-dependent epimerase/dehydratase family protein [Gemmobacter sp.]|nr:NAD-dependent epimerase/dehydratase family protein [Gemmobacter sp.]